MLNTRIIPCLDVKDGRTVKGVNFVGLQDAGDPVVLAKAYDAQGADELCFLDITASHEKRGTFLHVVSDVAECCFMPLTVGGGIRAVEDVGAALAAGADKVAINTAAITNPQLVAAAANKYGSQCIVISVDAKQNAAGKYEIFTHGGRTETGIDAVEWAVQMTAKNGAGEVLLTSMDRDGTKQGFNVELTRAVSGKVSVPVIASGGVGSIEHFAEGVLQGGASAVLAASVFHYGELTIAQVKAHMQEHSIAVRR